MAISQQTGILNAGPANSLTPIETVEGMGWVLTPAGWILPTFPGVTPVRPPWNGSNDAQLERSE